MPGRVAEVQQLPRAAVEFVGAHGVPFAGDAAGQDRHAVEVRAARGQMGKQVRVEQHGRLQRLGAAVAQDGGRQRVQQLRVAHDGGGLMERADEVFALRQVDSRLAADGRIHHGKQRRRHLHQTDAAQPCRGRKARQIADDAAAERNDRVGAGQARLGQLMEQGGILRQ